MSTYFNGKINGGAIDPYGPLSRSPAAGSGSSTAASSATRRPAARSDALSLTDDALLLEQTSRAVAESSEIDSSRVDSVRQSLRDGSYKIDASVIASRLMKTEWELYQ